MSSNKRDGSDEGTYWCVASNSHGTTRSKNATVIIAALGSDFQTLPDEADVRVRLGEPITLPCRPPKGSPEPEVAWQKDGVDVANSTRIMVAIYGDLRIHQVTESDSGNYICKATNAAGTRNSSPTKLTVLGKLASQME